MLINLVSCGFFDDESRSFSQLMMPSINLIIVMGIPVVAGSTSYQIRKIKQQK